MNTIRQNIYKLFLNFLLIYLLFILSSCNLLSSSNYQENKDIVYKKDLYNINYRVLGTDYNSDLKMIFVRVEIQNLSDNALLFDFENFELTDELDTTFKPFMSILGKDTRTDKFSKILANYFLPEKFEIYSKDSNSFSIGYKTDVDIKNFENKKFYWGPKNEKKVKLDVKL